MAFEAEDVVLVGVDCDDVPLKRLEEVLRDGTTGRLLAICSTDYGYAFRREQGR